MNQDIHDLARALYDEVASLPRGEAIACIAHAFAERDQRIFAALCPECKAGKAAAKAPRDGRHSHDGGMVHCGAWRVRQALEWRHEPAAHQTADPLP